MRSLVRYQELRDFAKTGEPRGGDDGGDGAGGDTTGARFVVQKHAARRLHYDLRLELDGVLLSWAVPRGPSLRPRTRRLAVRTEDHPIDYADFEGIIPAGEYGGGTMIVWDRGTWRVDGDAAAAAAALERGRLTFELVGEKLRGRWHLVRTPGDGKAETWLLFKGRDEAAVEDGEIVELRPESVISGRTLEQVRDGEWMFGSAPDVLEHRPV